MAESGIRPPSRLRFKRDLIMAATPSRRSSCKIIGERRRIGRRRTPTVRVCVRRLSVQSDAVNLEYELCALGIVRESAWLRTLRSPLYNLRWRQIGRAHV